MLKKFKTGEWLSDKDEVELVVEIVSALVRAEFLIGAATDYFAAIETFFFHSTKVSINI